MSKIEPLQMSKREKLNNTVFGPLLLVQAGIARLADGGMSCQQRVRRGWPAFFYCIIYQQIYQNLFD